MDKPLRPKVRKEKNTNQRLAGLQHRAQKPGLATKTDVETNTKIRKRTEGAAADRAKHGDTSSARVDHEPMRRASFGEEDSTEPPALPICKDDALVGEGFEAPKPCLSPGKMRT